MADIPTQETKFYLLERKVEEMAADMEKVKKALWGIDGDEDGLGLIAKVSMICEKMSAIEKIGWLIAGIVLATFGAVLYQLVVLHPLP